MRVSLFPAAALICALTAGCAGTRVIAEYEHHSSAADFYDRNTSDQVGFVVAFPLRFKKSHCSRYCPEIEAGLLWEVDKPVFGRNPVGTVRVRQPVYVFGSR